MSEGDHILISLEPRHAINILQGTKRVELRRRVLNVKPGTTVWFYAKAPVASVIGRARIERTHHAAPNTLWRKFSGVVGISREEFFAYFKGTTKGAALVLADAVRLHRHVSLKELRCPEMGCHPPQFFSRLAPGHPLTNVAGMTSKKIET